MDNYILEACVDSFESALYGAQGGANRLELCANLLIGGTTPGLALFESIRQQLKIRTHILIRPRFGDFCYSEAEFNIMKKEVALFREAGAEGVVFGILQPDGQLDTKRMDQLIREAGPLSVTLHRAFDVCVDPILALEQAAELGVETILTSGQQPTALLGKDLLRQLVQRSQNRIDILAGAGVNAQVIKELRPYTGIKSYHMSGSIIKDSPMTYRKENINMGLASLSEFSIWESSREKFEAAKKVLENIK